MIIDLARLESERLRLQASKLAKNTLYAYERGWSYFEAWCTEAGITPLPCTSRDVELYLVAALDRGLRLASAQIHVAAVIHRHREAGFPSPRTDSLKMLIIGARRHLMQRSIGKAALTVEQLKAITAQTPVGLRESRDRALLLLGFATGLRRSELCSLTLADVQFVTQGMKIFIKRSKTDQNGVGREVGIWAASTVALCPVNSTRAWILLLGRQTGPLYPRIDGGLGRDPVLTAAAMSGESVCFAVKREVKRIGLDVTSYGAHSLRAGCVTACVVAGASVLSIMQRTGHRSVDTVHRYVRPASLFDVNPLHGAL